MHDKFFRVILRLMGIDMLIFSIFCSLKIIFQKRHSDYQLKTIRILSLLGGTILLAISHILQNQETIIDRLEGEIDGEE